MLFNIHESESIRASNICFLDANRFLRCFGSITKDRIDELSYRFCSKFGTKFYLGYRDL